MQFNNNNKIHTIRQTVSKIIIDLLHFHVEFCNLSFMLNMLHTHATETEVI